MSVLLLFVRDEPRMRPARERTAHHPHTQRKLSCSALSCYSQETEVQRKATAQRCQPLAQSQDEISFILRPRPALSTAPHCPAPSISPSSPWSLIHHEAARAALMGTEVRHFDLQ